MPEPRDPLLKVFTLFVFCNSDATEKKNLGFLVAGTWIYRPGSPALGQPAKATIKVWFTGVWES